MPAAGIGPGRVPVASGRADASAKPYRGHRLVGYSYPWRRLSVAVVVVLITMVVASGFGAIWIPPHTVAAILLDKTPFVSLEGWWPDSWETIVWQLRVPRILLGSLVGASLAVSGATYQGLFRNPLADPYLIGVASGAGLGATIILTTPLPAYIQGFSILPLAAFGGALLAVMFSYVVASRAGGLPLAGLILSGIAIASLASAITGFLMIRSDPDVRPVLAWLMGSLSVSGWEEVRILLPYLFVGVVGMMAYGRILNLMQLGEDEAGQIGVNVQRTKLVLLGLAS
ncbi:MAG: iron chelate uptake ABC transporter family permease subunit, partial [Dehalococcoidia bacterium]